MNNVWGLFASVSIYSADTRGAIRGEAVKCEKETMSALLLEHRSHLYY